MNTSEMTERVFQYDFDRALSTRFAPRDKRHGLLLFLTFDHELAKIAHQTSQALLRRIRTQFWREALADKDGSGTDLAKQLVDCFSGNPVVLETLDELIETHEKYHDEAYSSELGWRGFNDRQAVLFKLSAGFLDPEDERLDPTFFDKCGAAFGGARQLCAGLDSPQKPGEETQIFLEQTRVSHESLARDLKLLSPLLRAAVLPIALVPPYLELYQTSDRKVSKPVDLHPLKKVWMLWRAARSGF